MNLMILAYFSGRWPWLMPYYFSVKFPILMAIRTYTFVKQDWGYFMLDWCGCSPPLPGPLPRYHGCHPQVSPLKTSDLEPPNRRQTPAQPAAQVLLCQHHAACLPVDAAAPQPKRFHGHVLHRARPAPLGGTRRSLPALRCCANCSWPTGRLCRAIAATRPAL